jgi:hypothetical protein
MSEGTAMVDPISKFLMNHVIDHLASAMLPVMVFAFVAACVARVLVYYTARAQFGFAREFEKRVRRYFADPKAERIDSFYRLAKKVFHNTFYETFELKKKYKRRNLDHVTTVTDRLFLIEDGVARLINDTLRQVRYLKKDGFPPKMIEVTKGVFDNNPVFTRLVGIFPIGMVNEILNILPGLLIIGGIFGTFLGVAKGLPELGGMDLGNVEETRKIMDTFLSTISMAMIKSIVGIALSVLMTLVNTLLSPDGLYYNLINRYSDSLESLWNETSRNDFDLDDIVDPAAASAPPSATSREHGERPTTPGSNGNSVPGGGKAA